MSLIDHIRREFAYDEWANQETLAAIGSEGDERSLQLMAHILSAERLWLERLRQQPQSSPVWPQAGFERCQQQLAELARLWREYLATTSENDLGRTASYKNSKGEPWTNSVLDILTHVIMHSGYHRGQIAAHLRQIGRTPAYTDFIHGIRQGLVR
jgi:uncharacterized damage-inducible protein DinB